MQQSRGISKKRSRADVNVFCCFFSFLTRKGNLNENMYQFVTTGIFRTAGYEMVDSTRYTRKILSIWRYKWQWLVCFCILMDFIIKTQPPEIVCKYKKKNTLTCNIWYLYYFWFYAIASNPKSYIIFGSWIVSLLEITLGFGIFSIEVAYIF